MVGPALCGIVPAVKRKTPLIERCCCIPVLAHGDLPAVADIDGRAARWIRCAGRLRVHADTISYPFEINSVLAISPDIRTARHTLGHSVVPGCDIKETMRVWLACSFMVCAGTVYAADAGSPDAALAVTRAFLGKPFSIIDPPTLTPDDKATVQVKQGKRACVVTLIRRALHG